MPAGGGVRDTLSRAERLRDRAAIEGLFRRGGRLEQTGFVLLWMQTEGKRAAVFTASRRLGSSVARTRARRRLREAYRRLRHLVPSHGLVMGFIARPAGAWMPFPELVGQMADALRHATRRAAS